MLCRYLGRSPLRICTLGKAFVVPPLRQSKVSLCGGIPISIADMKRNASNAGDRSPKKAKTKDYCDTSLVIDGEGKPIWPAPKDRIAAAQAFLREW